MLLRHEDAVAKIEAGEHVVEVTFTFMDGSIEIFYPAAQEDSNWIWRSADRDPDLYNCTTFKNTRGHLTVPWNNVRYYEVMIHNAPPRKERNPRLLEVEVPEGFEVCFEGGLIHLHPVDDIHEHSKLRAEFGGPYI